MNKTKSICTILTILILSFSNYFNASQITEQTALNAHKTSEKKSKICDTPWEATRGNWKNRWKNQSQHYYNSYCAVEHAYGFEYKKPNPDYNTAETKQLGKTRYSQTWVKCNGVSHYDKNNYDEHSKATCAAGPKTDHQAFNTYKK